jgi:hypothetical protein
VEENAVRAMLTISVAPDADAQELADLTSQLRRQLLELDVMSVELVRSADVPTNAKPVDAITIGALAVALNPAGLRAVIALVGAWLKRSQRKARITIGKDSLDLTGLSGADQHLLIEAFVRKHGMT